MNNCLRVKVIGLPGRNYGQTVYPGTVATLGGGLPADVGRGSRLGVASAVETSTPGTAQSVYHFSATVSMLHGVGMNNCPFTHTLA